MASGPEILAPGVEIDGFRLEEVVHAGGMATIWRVTRADLALPTVMKVPRLGAADNPSFILCFEVEQMILPRLSGRHVPRFVGSGDITSQPYLAMEQVAGGSLEKRLPQAPFEPDTVAEIGAQVALALNDVHRQHVLHLDLTPDNILLRDSREAVLIDFGLSRHDFLPDLLAEELRLPMGTAPYISPEQVLHVRSDPRSDLFSLGVVLYELSTGEQPFGNPQTQAGLRQRLYMRPVPPRARDREFPDWLQEIILRCLEVDPAARYRDAAQLAFALQHPDQVLLTERATRSASDGAWSSLRRRLQAGSGTLIAPTTARPVDSMPIVMAAVDTTPGNEALAEALRETVVEVLATAPHARLTCVTVRKTPKLALDVSVDEAGRNLQVQVLSELKRWARPLDLADDRISFHVLEYPDPAAALVEYATLNRVAHLVIGARGSSTLRRFLGSTSARVVAEAPCTVTVVKLPAAPGAEGEGASG